MTCLSDLQTYSYWIGKSADEIRRAVIAHGGWTRVFPGRVPVWASRVRSYFNDIPNELKLLDLFKGGAAARRVNRFEIWEDFKAAKALSGDVYEDRSGRHWYEMHTAGTVYHYPGKVDWWKPRRAAIAPQAHIPVFKLVSPDGSGGSCEVCIHNWQLQRESWNPVTRGKTTIGKPGKWVSIRTKVVLDPVYQASYNYSETVVMGFSAHELRDVKSHSEADGFYLSIRSETPLSMRRFPPTDRSGTALAA
jgi:hypothetical protein